MTITNEIIESSLNCKYKAYLKINGIKGKKNEYELLQKEIKEKILLKYCQYINELKLDKEFPKTEIDYIFKQTIEVNNISVHLDAFEKTANKTKKNTFYFTPIFISANEKISQSDKLLTACVCYLLKETQYEIPEYAKIIFGKSLQSERIKVSGYLKKSEGIIKGIPSNAPPQILNSHCPICEYRDICREKAKKEDNISLLDKATSKVIEKYKKKGIFTIQQLSYIYQPRRRKKQPIKQSVIHNIELQALAIRTSKIYVQQLSALSKQPVELFLDIESIPSKNFYYLIGVLILKNREAVPFSLWANYESDEAQIWEQFLSIIISYPDAPIYHYGNYELKAIDILGKRYNTDVKHIQDRLINVNSLIYGKIYFPIYSNRLKELGGYLNATWSSSDASGLQSIVWRYRWEENHGDEYKQLLTTYNLEDCNAVILLTEKLLQIQESANALPEIDFADSPKKAMSDMSGQIYHQFGNILKFAHLSYNNKKISFQDNEKQENPSKIGGKIGHKGFTRTIPKANKTIALPIIETCPVHKCKLIQSKKAVKKTLTDMVFTKNTIRKTVIKYTGYKSYCSKCNTYFSPSRIVEIKGNVFGHNYKAWITYQRLFLRLPFEIIRLNFKELFNENISNGGITRVFMNFASFYIDTEKENLKNILNSPFIHVDETKVNVKGVDHYVWIFTSDKYVIFRETETREIDIVRELLAEYDGILITDFYPGYESMKCKHQKCWVHLIRNINEDLWKNPFDAEYEKFVVELRNFIIPIFESIKKFGSKKRHFNKFQKGKDKFYNKAIMNKNYHSEITLKYQKRLKKHWEALFTFLEFDNIPWNNNMAERGLRHLAVQRKISTYFANGINQYLLFLGIMQTCKFQNKSFLEFLLSGKCSL